MKRISILAAAAALAVTPAFGAWAAYAGTGGDDTPAAHVGVHDRHGADDAPGHARHARHGADDAAGHQRHSAEPEPGDDRGGRRHGGGRDDRGHHGGHHRSDG